MSGFTLKDGVFVIDVEDEIPTTPSMEILNICLNEYMTIRGPSKMSDNFIPMATHAHFCTKTYGKKAGMKFARQLNKTPFHLKPLEVHIIKKVVKLTDKVLA